MSGPSPACAVDAARHRKPSSAPGAGFSGYPHVPLPGGMLPAEVDMIMEWTAIDDLDAEIFGRAIVSEPGRLALMRGRFHISVRRLGQLLSTAGQVVARWEAEPVYFERMYRFTAVRLGQLA